MKYLILGDANDKLDADKLSRELYKLSRPDSVRDPKDVTTHLYGIVEHPVDGRVALQIPDDGEYELPIHSEKDSKELAKLYKKFFLDRDPNKGDKNKKKKDKVKDNIDNKKGGEKIKTKDMLPFEDFVDQVVLEADGWFPEPDENI